MSRLIQTISSLLEQGEDLVLATILIQEGSTPRTAGTRMVVRRGGDSIATVGGGLVEGEVMKAAGEVFQTRSGQVRPFDLTGTNAESMDLICGGRLEILVEFLEASPENTRIFRELTKSVRSRKKSYLVADLGELDRAPIVVKRCLVLENGTIYGDLTLASDLLEDLLRRMGKDRYPMLANFGGRQYLIEPSFLLGTVYLFGAGHVSQQVAPLAKLVDFKTVVLDDRFEFANRERFPDSDEIKVLSQFENSFQELDVDEESYIVIVTRGHLHDKTVLEQALRSSARYIGMIGSRKKRDRLYSELLAEGFTEKDIARVYAPIGTNIAAETPEEIGISIVGELIKVRASRDQ